MWEARCARVNVETGVVGRGDVRVVRVESGVVCGAWFVGVRDARTPPEIAGKTVGGLRFFVAISSGLRLNEGSFGLRLNENSSGLGGRLQVLADRLFRGCVQRLRHRDHHSHQMVARRIVPLDALAANAQRLIR